MSIDVRPHAELPHGVLEQLNQELVRYYSDPPPSYYEIADQASQQYTPELQPFHCDLVSHVRPGMSVLEMGCGSAHLCPHVEAAGAAYVGIDHSEKLLMKNREHYPRARFCPISTPFSECFDIVASLYTIEHVVDPPAYLEKMWKLCKPGGLIAVICPDFIDGAGMPPSFYYGKTAQRLRQKIRQLALGDAISHLTDLALAAPKWKSRAQSAPRGAFWINLKPRILHGAKYSIDADAVHLPRLTDITWWLEEHGGLIVATSRTLPGVADSVLRHNCYALARKSG